METSKRVGYIDFLKFIGLTCIIVAHVQPPDWALMLRSFDVPLMVILSSILARRSYERRRSTQPSAGHYLAARFKRLVFPTWLFITGFFLLNALAGRVFDVSYIAASYALTRYGMGYVWIILVYLYAMLSVVLFWRIRSWGAGKVAALLLVAYLSYEVAYHFGIGIQNKLVDTTFYYAVPYGILAYLGFGFEDFGPQAKAAILSLAVACFAALACYYWAKTGSFQMVQIAKYPPRAYYLSYGIACSFGLLMFCERHDLPIYRSRLVRFVSMHSMWIYLWHILVLDAYKGLGLPSHWLVKLLVVYAGAMATVVVVNTCLDRVERSGRALPALKYLRG